MKFKLIKTYPGFEKLGTIVEIKDNYETGYYSLNPEFWKKAEEKESLFITEDGVEIFEGYDKDGDRIIGYTCGFSFYDFSIYEKFKEKECVGVSLEFLLGNNLGVDRLDITVSDDKLTVEQFEEFCKNFYDFFKTTKFYKKE